MPVVAADLMRFPIGERRQSITPRDAMLYALSTGHGQRPLDPALARFHDDTGLDIVPTFANVLGHPGPWLQRTGVDWSGVVHAEQRLVLHEPLAAGADIVARTHCIAVVDRGVGKGAFVSFERVIADQADGRLLASVIQTDACRFDGGCGSAGLPPSPLPRVPAAAPDTVLSVKIPEDAALLYRLNGDYNRLHWDPDFAARAGFPRPILHGLCTFGYAGYLIGQAFSGRRLSQIAARFTAVVFPGDELTVEVWGHGDAIQFRGRVRQRDCTVLDNGSAAFHSDGRDERNAASPPVTSAVVIMVDPSR